MEKYYVVPELLLHTKWDNQCSNPIKANHLYKRPPIWHFINVLSFPEANESSEYYSTFTTLTLIKKN